MLGEVPMLHVYTGLQLFSWRIKPKVAKAPAEDKSLLKILATYIIQNYSAGIPAATWWMHRPVWVHS